MRYNDDYFYIILGIMTVIIILFMMYVLLEARENFVIEKGSEEIVIANGTNVVNYCPTGMCAVDISSGYKTCPSTAQDVIPYETAKQVCSSRFACDNPRFPYAIGLNNETITSGICPTGVACNCSSSQGCTNLTSVIFTGGGLDQYNQKSYYFLQTASSKPYTLLNNSINYSDFDTTCVLRYLDLSRITPNPCKGGLTQAEIQTCINSNPCVLGYLNFVVDDVNTIIPNISTLSGLDMSCILLRNSCSKDQIPVFDRKTQSVVCLKIS